MTCCVQKGQEDEYRLLVDNGDGCGLKEERVCPPPVTMRSRSPGVGAQSVFLEQRMLTKLDMDNTSHILYKTVDSLQSSFISNRVIQAALREVDPPPVSSDF